MVDHRPLFPIDKNKNPKVIQWGNQTHQFLPGNNVISNYIRLSRLSQICIVIYETLQVSIFEPLQDNFFNETFKSTRTVNGYA